MVTNVAAFGAFIDIGVHQDGLVHVSAMSNTFVKDPRDVVKSGDIVRVKVLDVDIPRKRISLTLRLDDEATPAAASGEPRGERRGGPSGQPRGGQPGQARGGQPGQGRGGQPGQGRGGQPGQGRGGQSGQGRGGSSGTPRSGQRPDRGANVDTALADALRRAGYTPK